MANLSPNAHRPPPGGSPPGGSPPGGSPPGGSLSQRATLVVGFLVAGAALVALADVAPQAALGLTGVLGLGVILGHAGELQTLSNAFVKATGH